MKQIIISLSILFLSNIVLGQSIRGKIISENKQPISDVNILNLRTGKHTHSSDFGNFILSDIKISDTLIFNRLSYKVKSIIVKKEHFDSLMTVSLYPKSLDIDEVVISESVKSLNIFSDIDINAKPVNSSQEILRTVPGLIIGQHAGGGKAEQIFLRGFDNDHGTDINITVEGIPVNLVSHAHGQGYADLHFLIPEVIEKIDYGKGPYYADKGNFTTTGYVDFKTKNSFENSFASVEYGDFNTLRSLGIFNLLNSNNQHAYIASEFLMADGAFESSQNFNRMNVMGKYSANVNNNYISVLLSHFKSKWNASGQIPQRAVDAGLISRMGSIDDTEGGFTGRSNLLIDYTKHVNEDLYVKNKMFYSVYDFELYSNFTFFLKDSINGDQIKQKEQRTILGAETEINKLYKTSNTDIKLQTAFGFNKTNVYDNELSHTKERKYTLENLSFGDVDETDIYTYFNAEFDFGKLLINPAIRIDYFKFDYVDKLDSVYNNSVYSDYVAQPKLNFVYNFNKNSQLFLKTGIGFHSNDTRVSVSEHRLKTLPAAYGADFGSIIKLSKNIIVNATVWYLYLEQEFVYVGDEAVVEPSGKTKRLGADIGMRYKLKDWLFLKGDFNYSYARSINEPEGFDFIPLAPIYTSTGGVIIKHHSGISGGIQYRYISDRPANEDYSITAKGYAIADVNITYTHKKFEFGISAENLLNTEWKETQFATETRLFNEVHSVDEIHFIPGTPFFLKAKIGYKF